MGKYANLLKIVREKFERYQTYYQILNVTSNEITDEKIQEAYNQKCRELELMLRNIEGEEVEEIREIIQTALDDAYNALKTEHSRKNYQDILNKMEGTER